MQTQGARKVGLGLGHGPWCIRQSLQANGGSCNQSGRAWDFPKVMWKSKDLSRTCRWSLGILCSSHLLTHHDTFLCPFLTAPDVSHVFFYN